MSGRNRFCFDGVDFSRVAIIGSPGSGKTTLSVRLQPVLGVSAVHLDREMWLPGWNLRPEEERIRIHADLIDKDNWLIDGMWGSLVEERYKRATCVIHLDYPWTLCLSRAYKRCQNSGGAHRFDMAEGCPDKMDSEFVDYIVHFRDRVGKKLRKLEKDNPQVALFRLTSPKQTDDFLAELLNYFNKQE